jgi:di/tricarboxylate transporter
MGNLTPHATGPRLICRGCGYISRKDYCSPGAVFGVICVAVHPLIGYPCMMGFNT